MVIRARLASALNSQCVRWVAGGDGVVAGLVAGNGVDHRHLGGSYPVVELPSTLVIRARLPSAFNTGGRGGPGRVSAGAGLGAADGVDHRQLAGFGGPVGRCLVIRARVPSVANSVMSVGVPVRVRVVPICAPVVVLITVTPVLWVTGGVAVVDVVGVGDDDGAAVVGSHQQCVAWEPVRLSVVPICVPVAVLITVTRVVSIPVVVLGSVVVIKARVPSALSAVTTGRR